jgi:hypothetical protein
MVGRRRNQRFCGLQGYLFRFLRWVRRHVNGLIVESESAVCYRCVSVAHGDNVYGVSSVLNCGRN